MQKPKHSFVIDLYGDDEMTMTIARCAGEMNRRGELIRWNGISQVAFMALDLCRLPIGITHIAAVDINTVIDQYIH